MAEKSVVVRLSAAGGRKVKATLQGIGQTGRRSFGRLSREMEAANKRIAGFARAAARAAKVGAAALAGSLALVLRNGLQVIDQQAKLAQSLDTTTRSVQVLARAAELSGVAFGQAEAGASRLTRRLSLAAQEAGPAAGVFDRLGLSIRELQTEPLTEQIVRVNEAINELIPAAEQAAVRSKVFGEEGFKAFSRITTANIRQAAKDVREFGVAVSEADAGQIERTNDALSRLVLIGKGLRNQIAVAAAPALEGFADSLAAVSKVGGPVNTALTAVLGNLERLGAQITAFATFMGGVFVKRMAAAAFGIRGAATALVALRAALIRTGIGALIVGAGELLFRFNKLQQATGSFGEAVRLLGEVAAGVWDKIEQGGAAMAKALQATFAEIRTAWLSVVASLQQAYATFLRDVSGRLAAVPGARETAVSIRQSSVMAQSGVYATELARDRARAAGERLRAEAQRLSASAQGPIPAARELAEVMKQAGETGRDALDSANEAAERVTQSVTTAGTAAETAGTKATEAANDTATAAEDAATGWKRVRKSLGSYAEETRKVGEGIGDALRGAFQGAEQAIGQFVRKGKLDVSDLATSIVANLARISARRFVTGPLARLTSGLVGGLPGSILHAGGVAGGAAPQRTVPAMAFAGAPRLHAGGVAGLTPDEVPAILQRGERVLSRGERRAFERSRDAPRVTVNIATRDAESFRQSRTQVTSDIARAVAMGRRGM